MEVTIITTTFSKCKHLSFTHKRISVDFFIFRLSMLYQVCNDCSKLTPTQKYWKFNLI